MLRSNAAAMNRSLAPIHWLLSVQTLVILLGSLNRLGSWTQGYVAGNEFMRWVDLHNMLTLPLISVTGLYLLKRELEATGAGRRERATLALNLVFLLGLYLFAASYGAHETTNYLHERFCPAGAVDDLCRIIIFHDDSFSHWLFFTGFALLNGALMLLQATFPWPGPLASRDMRLLGGNALFVALGIFANLGFEEIGLDLYVVLGLALLAAWLWWWRGRQPLLVYYTIAYGLGLLLTLLVRSWSL